MNKEKEYLTNQYAYRKKLRDAKAAKGWVNYHLQAPRDLINVLRLVAARWKIENPDKYL